MNTVYQQIETFKKSMLVNQQPIKAAVIESKLKQIKIDTEKQIEHIKSEIEQQQQLRIKILLENRQEKTRVICY